MDVHSSTHELHTRIHTHTQRRKCVFVQVNVMSVISQGFDYRPDEMLCSQAVGKAVLVPAQAPQPFSLLTTVPVSRDAHNSTVHGDLCALIKLKVLNAHISLQDQDHPLQACNG